MAMKNKIRGIYLFISSVFIGLFHLTFAFAKSATGNRFMNSPVAGSTTGVPSDSLLLYPSTPAARSIYDSLQLQFRGLSQEAFNYAKKGFDRLLEQGKLINDSIISIIDFSLPSSEKRMFILDMKNYRVLNHSLVSHGQNSGLQYAVNFSNKGATHMSSPGFYITRETYQGGNGYSLKLDGMERGINDNAYRRGIVVHGAAYVNESIARARGYIGRSHGCPAVPSQDSREIINQIKGGSMLFIYHPSYISRSTLLNNTPKA